MIEKVNCKEEEVAEQLYSIWQASQRKGHGIRQAGRNDDQEKRRTIGNPDNGVLPRSAHQISHDGHDEIIHL